MSRKRLIAITLLFIIIVSIFSGCKAETLEYEKTEVKASVVKIIGQPNVRSEAFVRENSDGSNSYGTVDKDGFTIAVNGLFEADVDWHNGQFYGFKAEDVLSQPEGAWFPHGIEKDPDGIVWINYKYVIIAP